MMLLFQVGGKCFWHNESPGACFIIDDPLLRKRYGFLSYDKLLALMERERFTASIAFIPWNRKRSHQRIAELFRRNPCKYSLCVHGCDHTRGEFGGSTVESLQQKAQRALDRMAQHQELTGLAFDSVMVFPQGIFSSEAMDALSARGYLAAVNSTHQQVNRPETLLLLRDLLEVAVTCYSLCPLFVRHYPSDMAGLAFDLFLGKPALLVEHHGYFGDGYAALRDAVRQLDTMQEGLAWDSLGEVCTRACVKRMVPHGEIHIRFYCDRFRYRNDCDQTQACVFCRYFVNGAIPNAVIVNGTATACGYEDGFLRIPHSLTPGQAVEIRIERDRPAPLALPTVSRPEGARVFLRRKLSEIRDNHVQTNRTLNALASMAGTLLARIRQRLSH
jgi:hypothetical protein